MANGELEIKGLEQLNKLVIEFKGNLESILGVIVNDVKATEASSKAKLDEAKTLQILNKTTIDQQKAEEQSALNKIKLQKATESLNKATDQQTKAQKLQIQIDTAEKGSREQLSAQYSLNTIRLNAMSEAQRNSTKEGKKLTEETNNLKNNINKLDQSIGNHTGSVGKYTNAMTQLPGVLGSASGQAQMLGQSFKALFASPIGLIALAVGALYEIFKKFDPLVETIEKGLAALGSIFSTLKDTVLSVVTGQKSLWQAVTGVGDAMKKAAKEGWEYKQMQQDVEEMTLRLTAHEAKYKRQIDELLLQSKNRTLSEKERMGLIDQALAIEKKAYEEKAAIAEKEYQIEINKISSGRNLTEAQKKDIRERGVDALLALQKTKDISDEEIQKFAEAEAKRESVLNESVMIQEKAMNRRDQLEEKAQKDREKRDEKIQKEKEKRLEKEKKDADELIKYQNDAAQAQIDWENYVNEQKNKSIQEQYDAELAKLSEQYILKSQLEQGDAAVLEAIEQEHKDKLLALEIAHQQLIMGAYEEGSTQYKTALKALQDLQVSSNQSTNQQTINDDKLAQEERKKLAEQYAQIYSTLAQNLGSEYARMLESGKVSGKEFLKATIKTALDSLKALAYIYIANITGQELATKGFPVGLITAGVATIALETAIGAAKYGVSQFAKGTKDAPGGLAFVGEKGRELVTLPDGSKYLTPDHATLTVLPKHTEVTPAHMVEQELRKSFDNGQLSKNDNRFMSDIILQDMNKSIKTMASKKTSIVLKVSGANMPFVKMVKERYRA